MRERKIIMFTNYDWMYPCLWCPENTSSMKAAFFRWFCHNGSWSTSGSSLCGVNHFHSVPFVSLHIRNRSCSWLCSHQFRPLASHIRITLWICFFLVTPLSLLLILWDGSLSSELLLSFNSRSSPRPLLLKWMLIYWHCFGKMFYFSCEWLNVYMLNSSRSYEAILILHVQQ